MIIVGLSPTVHESAVGIVVDGQLIAAAAEERFTRKKNQGGFPHRSLQFVMQQAGVRPSDVDCVAYAALPFAKERNLDLRAYFENIGYTMKCDAGAKSKALHLMNYTRNILMNSEWTSFGGRTREIMRNLREYGLAGKLTYVDHHLAHIASAYYTSGFDQALAVSLDGYGSGAAGSFYLCEAGSVRLLQRIPYPHSLGTFYRRITQALGFKPNRHEGKVVGLAAYGSPAILYDRVVARFDLTQEDYYRFKSAQDPYEDKRLADQYSREDVASAYQKVLEDIAARYVGLYVNKHKTHQVVAAGGVFANVKMNQRIMKLPGVDRVFVFPAMSDGGVGVGAALFVAGFANELRPFRLNDVYLGPEFTKQQIEIALNNSGSSFQHVPDMEEEIARLLAKGKVVARFDGRMEFGPRALGNRSILCRAVDPSIHERLNKQLGRTDFMPFAPVTPLENAELYYDDVQRGGQAAAFMTITLDCKDEMKRKAPAAVHVDGTARPQLINEQSNPPYYRILRHYHSMTGLHSIINTSFNMHEEPIVCTPEDAIRSFHEARLDNLAIGPFLVSSNHSK